MDTKPLTRDLSVSAQITAHDVAAAADQGFRSIVCNRPDGEEPGQPTYSEIASAATAAGLEIRHVPVISGAPVEPADALAFAQALEALPKPVLAYCRSGTRSSMLWSAAEAGGLTGSGKDKASG